MEKTHRQRYLKSFVRRMELMNRDAHLAPGTYIEPDKNLVDTYVEPEFDIDLDARDIVETAHHELAGRRKRYSRRSLAEMLRRGDQLRVAVVLGDPGSGKSVALRRLGIDLARAALENERSPVPIYIPLGTFTQEDPTPDGVAHLVQETALGDPAEQRLSPDDLRHGLSTGGFALLFDGMDEMPRHRFSERFAALREFVDRHPTTICLFACRIGDFLARQFKVQQIRLMPFRRSHVAEFLRLFLGLDGRRARGWARKLLAPDSPLAAMATNPLFLTLVASYVAQHEAVPRSQAEIFRSFVKPRLNEALEAVGGTDAVTVEDVLSRVAFAMTVDAGVGTTLPFTEALERAEVDESVGAPAMRVARTAGFVRFEDETGAFRFLHHRLQEFFAANALVTMPEDALQEHLVIHLDDPWWEEVYLLLASMGADMAPLVRKVLREVGSVDEDDQGELLRHEARLILVGHLLQNLATPLPPELVRELGDVACTRFEATGSLPELRQVRALRAIRGVMLEQGRPAALVRKSLEASSLWVQEEAFLASTSGHDVRGGRRLILSLYRDGLRRNFLMRYPSILKATESEPRLAFLGPHAFGAALLNLLILVGLVLGAGALGYTWFGGWFWGTVTGAAAAGLLAFNLYQRWQQGDDAGVVVRWARICVASVFAACATFGLSIGSWALHRALEGPVPFSRGSWDVSTLGLELAIGVGSVVLVHGLFSLATGKAWEIFTSFPRSVMVGIWRGAWCWGVLAMILELTALVRTDGALPELRSWFWGGWFMLLLVGISVFIGLRPTRAEIRRTLSWFSRSQERLKRRSRAEILSSLKWILVGAFKVALAVAAFGGGIFGLVWIVGQASGLFSSAGSPQTLSDTMDRGKDLVFGLFGIIMALMVALSFLIGIPMAARDKLKQLRRYAPSSAEMGTVEGIVLLLNIASRKDLGTRRRLVALRKLGEVEPPSEVLVEALSVLATDRLSGRLATTAAQSVDNLQQRLRREAKKEPRTRLRWELDLLEAIPDEVRVVTEESFNATLLRWDGDGVLSPLLEELAGDEVLAQLASLRTAVDTDGDRQEDDSEMNDEYDFEEDEE